MTKKGEKYGERIRKKSSSGGYYAQRWSWLEFDESILNELNIDDTSIDEIRLGAAKERKAKDERREKAMLEYRDQMNAIDAKQEQSASNTLGFGFFKKLFK